MMEPVDHRLTTAIDDRLAALEDRLGLGLTGRVNGKAVLPSAPTLPDVEPASFDGDLGPLLERLERLERLVEVLAQRADPAGRVDALARAMQSLPGAVVDALTAADVPPSKELVQLRRAVVLLADRQHASIGEMESLRIAVAELQVSMNRHFRGILG
jgi:hypothetical protein